MTARRCPDDGACHHGCVRECFRVKHCAPLSGVFPGDQWPETMTATQWHEYLVKLGMEAWATSYYGSEYDRAYAERLALEAMRERMAQAAQVLALLTAEADGERTCTNHGIERRRCGCAAL